MWCLCQAGQQQQHKKKSTTLKQSLCTACTACFSRMNAWLITLIVVACVATFYFGIGIVVRYHSGLHHCPEVLPNYRFWCGILAFLARVATCGRWRLSFDRNSHVNGISTLPSRPGATTSARGVQFELLASDADEDYDINRAMQPAEVVVKY